MFQPAFHCETHYKAPLRTGKHKGIRKELLEGHAAGIIGVCMRFLARVILYLAVVLALNVASARETVYSNINCAVTFPLGWNPVPVDEGDYVAIRKSPDGKKTVVLRARAVESSRWAAVNEEFKQEARKVFLKEGTIQWEKEVTVDGQPAWEFAGEGFFEGKRYSAVSRIFIAGAKAYKVNTIFVGGDAGSAPELQACLKSFRFLQAPPPLPRAGVGTGALGLVAMGGCLGAVAGGGIWLIQRQRKRPAASGR